MISAEFKMVREVPVRAEAVAAGPWVSGSEGAAAKGTKDRQAAFDFKSWGGRREGAGRPRKPGARLAHGARPSLAARFPAHVTLRALPGSPNLRRAAPFAFIEAALRASLARTDFRVVHFSVQTNHVHLLVEAQGANALARGMQALAIRVARGVNRAAGRKGKLWADRYHARVLRSPREVRWALAYVLQNARRHLTSEGGIVDPGWIDPRSSGGGFDGWRDGGIAEGGGGQGADRPAPAPSIAAPRTWLLAVGWRRHGLLRHDEVPAAALG